MSLKPLIILASHKPYENALDSYYLPVQAGAAIHGRIENMAWDDEGEHISNKNPYYSELTALYYAWKNLEASHIGLVHYRRLFKGSFSRELPVLSNQEIDALLEKSDCILPRKRNYVIENLYDHYAHSHYAKDLDLAREVISSDFPEYLEAFDTVMKRRSAHMFNMFIMKQELFDAYCSFLFPLLKTLETKIDLESYDPFQKRVLGRISELMLDVFLETHQISYKEVPLWFVDGKQLPQKVYAVLKGKITKKKYEKSF